MTFNRMVPQPTMTPEEVAAWRRWRETAHLVLMGDGEERPEPCACSGFRPEGCDTEEEAGRAEGWADAVEARSLLAEALAVASAGFADGEGEPS